MKLKAKLFWAVFIGVVCGIVALNSVLSILGHIFDDGYAPDEIQAIAITVSEQAELSPEAPVSQLIATQSEQYPGVIIDWFDLEGNLLYSTEPQRTSYSVSELLRRSASESPTEYSRSFIYELTMQRTQGLLVLTVPREYVQSQYFIIYFAEVSTFFIYLIPVLLFIFAPALAALILVSSINRRIRRLNRAMQASDLNQMSLSLEDRSKDEIGQLTRIFKSMSMKIQTQFEHIQKNEDQRKKLVSNLSHNLRTPLTSIIGYADTLNRDPYRNKEERRQWVSIILSRSLYMERLLKQLFHISLSDQNSFTLNMVDCDVYELVREIAADYIPIFEDKGLEADIRIPDGELLLQLDAVQLEQAIRNLIDNALVYGDSGGYIGIYAEKEDVHVKLSIVDKGPGIAEEEQPFIFRQFYRSPSNAHKSNGLGLGLAIISEIATAHGGSVHLYSVPNEKTAFSILLPLNISN